MTIGAVHVSRCLFFRSLRLIEAGPTTASSEQEAASTLVPVPESVSRCLLSLTQALGASSRPVIGSRTKYHPRMTISASPLPTTQSRNRWFYSVTSLGLLVFMFIGFQLFYLHGQAYPGRPLTPPIRMLVITHACLMTLWMLLAVTQPLLVGAGHKRWHMKLGVFGVVLAAAIVITGLWLGIEGARVAPPELRVFGLAPREFMAVPVLSIVVFGLFVLLGVANRRRPEVHRPMMLMASLSIIGAALGRMTPLNALYAGTWWETVFSAFLMQSTLAAIVLAAKCIVFKSFDRWFAAWFAAFTAVSVAISLGAKTQPWNQFATFLLQL